MTIQVDLTEVWAKTVRAGHICNRFRDWHGRQVEVGVRLGDRGPEQYAFDTEKGTEIGAAVIEREIDDTGLSVQWNQFRALKPQVRPAGLGRQADYPPGVNDCFFACQNPAHPLSLLRRDRLVHLSLPNEQWAALYNAFPVEKDGHFLWVPITTEGAKTAYPHRLQILTRSLVEDFLALGKASSDALTLFNSLHAGASVNHIHFHTVARRGGVPIERASAAAMGPYCVLEDYPAVGLLYQDPIDLDALWRSVDKLQRREVPLNLIYSERRLHLFARDVNNEMIEEFPGGVMACMELSGRLITTEEHFYSRADRELLNRAFRKITLGREALLRALG
jgi:diadenosine tetraphosphate (Ap4A) HIT family hydrolase